VDLYLSAVTVVANESLFAKFVHERADPGSGRADHLCQGFLTNSHCNWLLIPFVAKVCKKKQMACEPSFGSINQLIDQVIFDAVIARYQMGHEKPRNLVPC
jgi:hypothetical protein